MSYSCHCSLRTDLDLCGDWCLTQGSVDEACDQLLDLAFEVDQLVVSIESKHLI